jgi:hypothetical protein
MTNKNINKRKTISGILVSFLILVVVFVGVSTATFAWYSAVNRAIGNSITFTSEAQDQIGGDLAIGFSSDTTLSSITFDTPQSTLYPMIPKTEADLGTTTYYDFITDNFNSSAQSFNESLQDWICSYNGQDASPYTCVSTQTDPTIITYNHFFLVNKKLDTKQTVYVKYTITGDLADCLHVALFIGDPNDDNTEEENIDNMTLVGIMSNTSVIYYDIIAENDIVEDTPIMNNVQKDTSEIYFLINEDTYKYCTMVAWLDGVNITNDDATKDTSFKVTFEGITGDLTQVNG